MLFERTLPEFLLSARRGAIVEPTFIRKSAWWNDVKGGRVRNLARS